MALSSAEIQIAIINALSDDKTYPGRTEKFKILKSSLIKHVDEGEAYKSYAEAFVAVFSKHQYASKIKLDQQIQLFQVIIEMHFKKFLEKKLSINVLKVYYFELLQPYRFKISQAQIDKFESVTSKALTDSKAKEAARLTTESKLAAITSTGLPDVTAGAVPGGRAERIKDEIKAKISSLSVEYKIKILDYYALLINGNPVLKNDTKRLSELKVSEDDVKLLNATIYSAFDQNSNIVLFADIKATLIEHEKAMAQIEKVIQSLTKSKEESVLDILIGIGFSMAFSGLLVGAIGAIASKYIKNIKAIDKTIDWSGPAIQITIKDFWTTANGKILDEALKDGLKQGLRDRIKLDKVKKYFEEDATIVLDKLTPNKYPLLSLMAFQMEQYGQLLIVLASLGFLKKNEIDSSTIFFKKRFEILSTTENKYTYINILVKEILFSYTLNYYYIVGTVYDIMTVNYERGVKKELGDARIKAKAMYTRTKSDYLDHDITEFTDINYFSFDLAKIKKDLEDKAKGNENIVYIGGQLVIYNIIGMDNGVFLEITAFKLLSDGGFETNVLDYFIGFTSHLNGNVFINSLRTTVKSITQFENKADAENLYPFHQSEKALLNRISN